MKEAEMEVVILLVICCVLAGCIMINMLINAIDAAFFESKKMYNFYRKWLSNRRIASYNSRAAVFGHFPDGCRRVNRQIAEETKHITNRESWIEARRNEVCQLEDSLQFVKAERLEEFLDFIEAEFDEEVLAWCEGRDTKSGIFIREPVTILSFRERNL